MDRTAAEPGLSCEILPQDAVIERWVYADALGREIGNAANRRRDWHEELAAAGMFPRDYVVITVTLNQVGKVLIFEHDEIAAHCSRWSHQG